MEFFSWDESKKIKQAIVQQGREFVFAVLETRFEYVSSYVTKVLHRINDLAALKRLHKKAVTVGSLEEFEQFVRLREYAVDEHTAKIRNLWNFKISPIPAGYVLQLWDPQNRHFWHRTAFKSYKKAENFAKTLIRVCPYGIDPLAQHRLKKTLLPRLMDLVGTNFIYQGWMVEIGRTAHHGYSTVAYDPESGQKAFELQNFDTREDAIIAVKERIEEIDLTRWRVSSKPYRDEISTHT